MLIYFHLGYHYKLPFDVENRQHIETALAANTQHSLTEALVDTSITITARL
jgi:hypothetical protein